ncbi:RNA methyltransferase [Alkalihalobacillus alcalophilus ATCC 27647 = CGMCC 1.3604]|uniref:RNA methyltransferase n=1 Tax=Alkalihalobacillus alcalophilus ATCC 27647 = CGMCC 1.3604 TaxID=1218173 RepID=A0A094XAH9_ALKAL|nr:RsmD family RNA methyltransferase [Alkalihalobacillus alcalophilus]KGA95765.1 RNA methyltransferase [Alkalihalobacillus alcalophilus ATCC 27647 = CGMCC 1.3604]MED1560613.1 RsmD family RNA methyltransferase [Alkalihalobacillus alcalophilus]THG88393.1 RNA methyltransferase [Alkalihalobacillus alcalophilus ATCC 27647 = CGMCC 1.3604]
MLEEMIYLYIFNCHEDELELSFLEKRSLFGVKDNRFVMESSIKIEPSRSPFLKARINVVAKANTLAELKQQLNGYQVSKQSFKVIMLKNDDLSLEQQLDFQKRKQIEREIGQLIVGRADLKCPAETFAVIKTEDAWYFGEYTESVPVWLKHQQKPRMYSTALNTRVARAVVNIAVPKIEKQKAIDPCCGIGTVMVEALSMGIQISGSDINPLAAIGARENIAHFQHEAEVKKQDIRTIEAHYDVAIIDMPYNLCSVVSEEEKINMLRQARKFTKRLVIVTVEPIDTILEKVGFFIKDRCVVKKSRFEREVLVCE